MKILLYDTETTGLNPEKSYIISLGFIFFDSETKETKRFYQLVNWKKVFPNFNIPESTIAVHGITNEELSAKGIHPKNAFSNLFDFILENGYKDYKDHNNHIIDLNVAFNLPYDQNMMISNLKFLTKLEGGGDNNNRGNNSNIEDVYIDSKLENLLSIFTKTYDNQSEVKNDILFIDSLVIDKIFHFDDDFNKVRHSLEEVGLRYDLGKNLYAHNAMGDTERLLLVFQKQMEELNSLDVEINQKFENRLINKYINDGKIYSKKQLDYLGENMNAVE